MTTSGVCWTMFHSEFSTCESKLCWCSAGVSWLFRALRDVSDESLLAKYLLLLLLPELGHGGFGYAGRLLSRFKHMHVFTGLGGGWAV